MKSISFLLILSCLGMPGAMAQMNQPSDSTVTDIDKNTYAVVAIGNQRWMAENLRVKHYSNGDPIPNIRSAEEWQNLEMGAFCDYDNESKNASVYGHLYNWFAVSDSRNLCPVGWHAPSTSEWNILDSVMGNEAGNKLKANSPLWVVVKREGVEQSMFNALPTGFFDVLEGFTGKGSEARWWTATRVPHVNGKGAFYRYVGNGSKLGKGSFNRVSGCPVRCVKD
jgi:uncharacterized protein (TIGR02145 family)